MEQTGKKSILLHFICFLFSVVLHLYCLVYLVSFLDDIEVMLKWRPPVVYKYLWKYVCVLAMVGLLAASFLRMIFKRPTYTSWNQDTVRHVWIRILDMILLPFQCV